MNELIEIMSSGSKDYFNQEPDIEKITEVLYDYLSDPNKQGFVGLDKEGNPVSLLLAVYVEDHPMLRGKFVYETFWYSLGVARNDIFKEMEDWARTKGANYITFTCKDDDTGSRLDKIVKRKGYKKMEIAYAKELI